MNILRFTYLAARLSLGAALLSSFLLHPAAFAQGSLTPPGAPAPTMKKLDEIEPRTPISTVPFAINASGSYYLTSNLSVTSGDAITINVDSVTLDLNGFTISSTANPASGIAVNIPANGRRNISIKNGHILGTTTVVGATFTTGGFATGIFGANGATGDFQVADVNVAGIGGDGINLNVSSAAGRNLIVRCTVSVCSGLGMRAGSVIDSLVDSVGLTGISANIVSNCFAQTLGATSTRHGIGSLLVVQNSVGVANAGTGLLCTGQVTNSHGTSTSGTGVDAVSAQNSEGTSSSGLGLTATTASNCIGTSTSGVGLSATTASNSVGTSTSGTAGLNATVASFCQGKRDGGTAITATTAIGCVVSGTGTVTAANKFLGTP